MRLRGAVTPVVLLVLAAAAVVYAYGVDRGRVSDAEREARRSDVFPSFRVDDVTRIELSHGAEKLVLERGDPDGAPRTWRMTSPRDGEADAPSVDALLRELEMATRVRVVKPEEAEGLDSPRVRGEIAAGALTYRFVLGADAPRPEGAAYMRLDGEGTLVVARSLAAQLLRGADAYRERALVPTGGDDVARVEVSPAGGAPFVLVRAGATFRIGDPRGLRADRDAVQRLLRGLDDARADSFLDDDAWERAAQAQAQATDGAALTVDSKRDGRPRAELRLGGACPGEPADVVAMRTAPPPRVAACVPRVVLDSVRLDAAKLVDLHPLWAHADEISELRLALAAPGAGAGASANAAEAAGARVDLARRGTVWHERAPDDRDLTPAETESANALANALANATATEARPLAPGETLVPVARATIARASAGTDEAIDLAAPGFDGTSLARRADDGAVLRLPRALARRFAPHPVALRGRDVWRAAPFDPAAVTEITSDCGPVPERIELGESGHWTMPAPAGFSPDPGATSELAEAFARAKAEAWIAETDDGAFGFGKPGSCAVTLTLAAPAADAAAPPRRATVTFGAEGDGGVYARTSDDPAVFVAPLVLRNMAAHPLIDRRPFRLDPAAATAAAPLTIVRGGATVAVPAPVAGATDAASDSDSEPASDAPRTRLAPALAAFSAQCALHPGRAAPDEGFDHPLLEIRAGDRRITIGAATRVDGADAYFARVTGTDATFAVSKPTVDAVIGSL